MRALVQRVDGARVEVGNRTVGEIFGPGLLVLIGVTHGDTALIAQQLARKIFDLRIFDHASLALADVDLAPGLHRQVSARDASLPLLVVSQFTLYAETAKGRRPTWNAAAPGGVAEPLVTEVITTLKLEGARVRTGEFGADMRISLVNDGPVTLMLEHPPAKPSEH